MKPIRTLTLYQRNQERTATWHIVKLENGTFELVRIAEEGRKLFDTYTSIDEAVYHLENIKKALMKQGFDNETK